MTPTKYKAKDLKGKWVFGTPIETRPNLKFGFHKWWIIESAYSHGGYFYISKRKAIDEKTLCEVSDCIDVDKKPICNGDKVEYKSGAYEHTAEVVGIMPDNIILLLPNKDRLLYDNESIRLGNLKVIGNKYD